MAILLVSRMMFSLQKLRSVAGSVLVLYLVVAFECLAVKFCSGSS